MTPAFQGETFSDDLYQIAVTIGSGTAESGAVFTQGMVLVGVIMPAVWTAANLGIKAGLAAGSLQAAYDNAGGLLQAVVAASAFVALPSDSTVFAPWISVTSINTDKSGSAVNQGAARSITLLFRRYLS
ncbi:MAG: hypothetical protein LAQ69_22410 [Acidobacteriia bacterium]|nr:hypothetical protein [Terriglobia bacterium]